MIAVRRAWQTPEGKCVSRLCGCWPVYQHANRCSCWRFEGTVVWQSPFFEYLGFLQQHCSLGEQKAVANCWCPSLPCQFETHGSTTVTVSQRISMVWCLRMLQMSHIFSGPCVKISDSARNLSTPTRAFPVIWIIFLCHCFPSQPQHFTEVFPLRVYLGLSETPMDENLLFPIKMARPGFNPQAGLRFFRPAEFGVRGSGPWGRAAISRRVILGVWSGGPAFSDGTAGTFWVTLGASFPTDSLWYLQIFTQLFRMIWMIS